MNWGLSLLDASDVLGFKTALNGFFYAIYNMLSALLFKIWSWLAWFIDQIESIFRGLAGLNTEVGTDMASEIITNKTVGSIFSNLVAVCTAILIFFTIIKIIQQHYKEKDGGNPYIIVFRMFKGMLMFAFVTAACLVGLYASGVVFRALDAATGNGTTSISGQIFQAMAYDANRVRIGPREEGIFAPTLNKMYNRLVKQDFYVDNTDSGNEKPDPTSSYKYTIAKITGALPTKKDVEAAYADLAINKWAVVNSNGSLTPVSPYYQKLYPDGLNDWDNTIYNGDAWNQGDSDYDGDWGENGGGFDASASYSNDLLTALDVNISPKIDFSYSPLKIVKSTWKLYDGPTVPWTSGVLGNIFSGTYTLREFGMPNDPIEVAPGENEVFSINMNGGVSLQGGKASANFSLDMFKAAMPVEQIMTMISANVMLTNLVDFMVRSIPGLPLYVSVGPVGVDLSQIIAVALVPLLEKAVYGSLALLLSPMTTEDTGDYDEEHMEALMNSIAEYVQIGSTKDLPIDIKKYTFDANFSSIWEQLTNSWNDFYEQLQTAAESDLEKVKDALNKIDTLTSELDRQKAWAIYKGIVQTYNDSISNYLREFMADAVKHQSGIYAGAEAQKIADSLRKNFQNLVDAYAKFKIDQETKRPHAYKVITEMGQVYLPIFETDYTLEEAKSLSADAIINELNEGVFAKNRINLTVPQNTGAGVFRVVDWEGYDDRLCERMTLGRVADVYKSSKPTSVGMSQEVYDFFHTFGNSDEIFPYYEWQAKEGTFGVSSAATGVGTAAVDGDTDAEIVVPATTAKFSSSTTANERPSAATDPAREAAMAAFLRNARNVMAPSKIDPANNPINERDIITFRDMSVNPQDETQTDKDVKALKSWLSQDSSVKFVTDGVEINPVYSQGADGIDHLMSMRATDKTRRYLLLADPNFKNGNITDPDNQKSFVTPMGYNYLKAVDALYDLWSVNYFVGYVGIIIVLGVYMNFTFGLIQRAVNLAVLYMLSPISIAFYPFDDGQKFNGNFVMPFYKEAISAFAIIISLNLYFVLQNPVEEAAKKASGGLSIIAWITLIAFCSMLPKIRDMVTNLLGANSIAEKQFSSIFKDAGAALSSPMNSFKELQQSKLGKATGNFLDKRFRSAAKNRERLQKMTDWAKEKMGGTKLGQYMAAKKQEKLDKKAQMQANIDAARASGDDSKLTKAEKRLKKLQDKRAKKAAEKVDERLKNLTDEEKKAMGIESLEDLQARAKSGDKDAQKKLKDLEKRAKKTGGRQSVGTLLAMDNAEKLSKIKDDLIKSEMKEYGKNDDKNIFARAANGVMSAKAKVKGALVTGKNAVAGALKYTVLGDAMEALFHPVTGAMWEGGGAIGSIVKWMQPNERDKRLRQMNAAESEWRAARNDVDEVKTKQLTAASEGILQAYTLKDEAIRNIAAMNQAADGVKGMGEAEYKKRYLELATQSFQKKGKSAEEAKELAEIEWQANKDDAKEKLFNERGGMVAYVNDLSKGVNGLTIDEKYLKAAEKELEEKIATNDVESLKASLKDVSINTNKTVTLLLDDFQKKMNLKDDERLSPEYYETIVNAVNRGEDVSAIARKIATQIPQGEDRIAEIEEHLKAVNFENEVAKARVSQGSQASVISGAIDYLKKMDKAREWAYEDLNVDINSAAFQNFFQAYRGIMDKNMEGGLQKMEEQLRAKYNNDTKNPEFQRELNALQKKFEQQYEMAYNGVGSRRDARMYDYSVRQIEKEQAEMVNMLGKQYRNRIDYHLKVNMSARAKQVMNTDTAIRALKSEGDNVGAAMKMNEAIEAAMRQDWDTLKASGLDRETITQFQKWGESGSAGLKELKSIQEYYDITRKFLGNAEGNASGKGIMATRNKMAAMFQFIENREITEFYDRQIKDLGAQEAGLRRSLSIAIRSLENNFSSDTSTWSEAAKVLKLTDRDGKIVTDLGAYFKDVLNRVSTGALRETDEEFKTLTKKVANLSADWMSNKKLNSLMAGNRASAVLDGFLKNMNEGIQAMVCSDETDMYNGLKERLLKDGYQIYNKIEDQGGGDNKAKG